MSTYEERAFLDRIEGLFVGQLDDAEIRAFDRLVDEGRAQRSYTGAMGMMGLAQVKVLRTDSGEGS